ncbi:hypothetical protein Dsin_004769 [Dipteronia sinensis]|uniref:Uncharacterized protein n=1 Tax=Dipteronia sinensis TaxID=43782 RepID=A0AAE0AWH8_9ROSI|nr:hypothetical protein Dsin_004769 [Dipteronia sinensis]
MRAVAVAAAQRSGGSKDDVMPQHNNHQELPFTGYTLLHLSRPLVLAFSLFFLLIWFVCSKVTCWRYYHEKGFSLADWRSNILVFAMKSSCLNL